MAVGNGTSRLIGLLFFAASALGAAPGMAQAQTAGDQPNLRVLSDQIVGRGISDAAAPRAIVAISRHGSRVYYGYSGTGDAPLVKDTVIELGSITKVFTGVLLAEAFDNGTIDPNGSIQTYLPRLQLRPCTARITPVELADFSSGLPRMPDDLPQNLEQRGVDTYTHRDFLAWLERTAPRTGCDLPAPYLYSNASVGLLGPILANATGRPWQALVADDVTGPLGMVDTAVSPPREQITGFAGTQPAPRWPLFAWYAAGALRSTAQDMLAFGEAALGHGTIQSRAVPPGLRAAFQHSMRPVYSKPNGDGVGLSWESRADGGGGVMTWKDGGTAGFTTFIVVDQAKDCTIFLAANKADVPLTRLGLQLMQAMPE